MKKLPGCEVSNHRHENHKTNFCKNINVINFICMWIW